MLEDLADTEDQLTMFQVNVLRILFLTRQLSLKDAIDQMTKDRVADYIDRCDKALQRLGIDNRKIAVAGLNPHSGEGVALGMEEVEEITPLIEAAQKAGYAVVGPVPAGSESFHALSVNYD